MKSVVVLIILLCAGVVFSQSAEQAKLNNTAVELMDNDQYEEALPHLNELVAMNTSNTVFRYNRAVTFFNLKRYQEALMDYKILAEMVTDESEYLFQIGNAYEQLDSAKQAISFYSQAIEIEKDNFLYYFKRGTVQLKQNNFAQAEADFNAALYLNPKHDNSLHNRGIALYKLGQSRKACEDWCQAHQLGNAYSLLHIQKNCSTFNSCFPSK